MLYKMDRDDDSVIVSPSLVYSGRVDASKRMPEELNLIYMHSFEDHGHGKLFSDDDNSKDEVLLLASQTYESWYTEEHQIGVSYRSSSHSSAVLKAILVKQTSSSCSIPKVKNCNEVSQ